MDLDVESAVLDSPSRFTRILAVVVGIAAVVAALLAFAENHASRQEQRSLLVSARLAAAATGRIPATQAHVSFSLRSVQNAVLQQATGTARLLSSSEVDLDETAYLLAVAESDTAAGERLAAIAEHMGRVPEADSGLDEYTLDVLARGQEAVAALVAEQGELVDRAEVYSQRGNRAVLGLSILAVAAVLLGFAGAVRDSRPGVAALGAGSIFLGIAAIVGLAAVLA